MLFRKKALGRTHKQETVNTMGDDVLLREMSVSDRLKAFTAARVDDELDSTLLCFTVLVRSVYQDDKLVFEPSDAQVLADAPFDSDIDKLCAGALRINGLAPDSSDTATGN